MTLVDYSDSEGSEDEQNKPLPKPVPLKPAANSKFSIDKANPQKIRVQLDKPTVANGTHEEEPATKRPRVGGGGFGGFNAMLPPPKRDAEKAQTTGSKPPARKVFSLKTGAEPGFSRDSDAELRHFFAEQDSPQGEDAVGKDEEIGIPDIPKQAQSLPKPVFEAPKNTFMFKPLSVARNNKTRKKPINGVSKPMGGTPVASPANSEVQAAQQPQPHAKKVSLFPSGEATEMPEPTDASTEVVDEDNDVDGYDYGEEAAVIPLGPNFVDDSRNLDTIASDLNLSAADRRQLFGRGGKSTAATAVNVMNFNTDQEYAANQEAIANGEQIQHNPVRAIAPGKHSLRQLVSAAQGQKDALEESFASGRRNKKEA